MTLNKLSMWTTKLKLKQTLSVLDDLSASHAREGGVVGLQILDMIQRRDYAAICAFELKQNDYGWDVLQLMHCRQALAFYTKLEDLDIGVDKEAVAYQKFEESEKQCLATNRFFRALARGNVELLPRTRRHFDKARGLIAKVLGVVPRIEELNLQFGPGSTSSIKKRQAIPQHKLAETPTCSVELFRSPYLAHLFETMPHWLDCHVDFVHSEIPTYLCEETGEGMCWESGVMNLCISTGALQFVSKNAQTLRVMDVQPTLNTLVQGGLGRWLERRLERAGLGIRDQTKNQRLARAASIMNHDATLDLRSASETIATEAVKFFLPDGWYHLLRDCGCRNTTYQGRVIKLEKFASTGNGFTFPLETLIFWALTAAACESDVASVSVYGDDIICPGNRVNDVIRTLEVAGFSINLGKSFLSGPFRESCGADYYLGIDVRPYYQKKLVSAQTLFVLHNHYYADRDFQRYEKVRAMIPEPLRRFGPDEYGDGHLHSQKWKGHLPRKERRAGFSGFFFHTYKQVGTKIISKYPCDYVTPLYTVYTRAESHPIFSPSDVKLEFTETGRPIWVASNDDGDAYEEAKIYTFRQ
jgi:hypothetical protein